jgi:hypothetical protein
VKTYTATVFEKRAREATLDIFQGKGNIWNEM